MLVERRVDVPIGVAAQTHTASLDVDLCVVCGGEVRFTAATSDTLTRYVGRSTTCTTPPVTPAMNSLPVVASTPSV